MQFITTDIPGIVLVEPRRYADSRGYFMETYRKDLFSPFIGDIDFVQDNESQSRGDVLRGLHFQKGESAQAKLVRVVKGAVFDVAVDLRIGSTTFGKWFGTELNDVNNRMLFIPRGFAHGFMVLSPEAIFSYKVDNFYDPSAEVTICYNDADIAIEWPAPAQNYILSQRDKQNALSLKEFLSQINASSQLKV